MTSHTVHYGHSPQNHWFTMNSQPTSRQVRYLYSKFYQNIDHDLLHKIEVSTTTLIKQTLLLNVYKESRINFGTDSIKSLDKCIQNFSDYKRNCYAITYIEITTENLVLLTAETINTLSKCNEVKEFPNFLKAEREKTRKLILESEELLAQELDQSKKSWTNHIIWISETFVEKISSNTFISPMEKICSAMSSLSFGLLEKTPFSYLSALIPNFTNHTQSIAQNIGRVIGLMMSYNMMGYLALSGGSSFVIQSLVNKLEELSINDDEASVSTRYRWLGSTLTGAISIPNIIAHYALYNHSWALFSCSTLGSFVLPRLIHIATKDLPLDIQNSVLISSSIFGSILGQKIYEQMNFSSQPDYQGLKTVLPDLPENCSDTVFLDLSKNCDNRECIKRAYRSASKKEHPDIYPDKYCGNALQQRINYFKEKLLNDMPKT